MKPQKIILIILGCFALLLLAAFGGFLYVTRYRVAEVDRSISPDGDYTLLLQAVGEPAWPFGSAPGRLVLRHERQTISKTGIEVADDGAPLTAGNWNVDWEQDRVRVTLQADEQMDELWVLGFDGTAEHEGFSTHYGRPLSSESREQKGNDSESGVPRAAGSELAGASEETGALPDIEQLRMEKGYRVLYETLTGEPSVDLTVTYGARPTSSRVIISQTEAEVTYLSWWKVSENDACELYVLYRAAIDADGTWSEQEAEIVDIYAYVVRTGEVVSSGKTGWEDVGSEEYQAVTGEG